MLAALDAGGRSVSLTTDVFGDWVALGARADGGQVRATRSVTGGAFAVTAPAGATVTASPLLVSWSDGVPEQSRTGATTWLQGPPGGAWSITLDRVDVPRRLVVRAGERRPVCRSTSRHRPGGPAAGSAPATPRGPGRSRSASRSPAGRAR